MYGYKDSKIERFESAKVHEIIDFQILEVYKTKMYYLYAFN